MPSDRAEQVVCGFCGQAPETHGDSDDGPMTVCPSTDCEDICMTECQGPCGAFS